MKTNDFNIGKRIIIVGCGGSGKSHLSERLSDILNIEVYHLDKLFWLPGWVERDKKEFDCMCEEIYQKESFIIDGNFMRTMERRMQSADTLVWLDFSTIACVCGVVSRIVKNYGRVRADMGDGCPERFDPSFLKWIASFRKKTRPKIVKIADEAEKNGKKVIVLKNRRQVNGFAEALVRLEKGNDHS